MKINTKNVKDWGNEVNMSTFSSYYNIFQNCRSTPYYSNSVHKYLMRPENWYDSKKKKTSKFEREKKGLTL